MSGVQPTLAHNGLASVAGTVSGGHDGEFGGSEQDTGQPVQSQVQSLLCLSSTLALRLPCSSCWPDSPALCVHGTGGGGGRC